MRIIDFADGFESSEQPTSVSLPAAMVSNEPSGNLSADNVQDAVNELQSDVDAINAKVGAANGIASLDSNAKIPASQIPAVALVDVFQVADIAARDALTVEAGDVAVVADIGDGVSQSYWYNGSTWVEVVADAALATHIADNTNPHGVTKSQVGLDQVDNTSDSTKNSATATLTNKTIGDALTVTQVATPSAPASGFNKIYAKSDGSFYTLNSSGIESPVGSGSGGSKNYLGTVNKINGNGDFELGTTSKWSLGNVSINSTTKFPSGAPTFGSGASVNLAISVVSANQLAGSYSLSYASSAATTAGNFLASDAFTIDKADQAKPQKFQFSYEAVTNPNNGNYSGTTSNSFGVAIYDVTNAAWIQPSGCFSMTQNAGVGIASGEFQTSSNGTQYRIVVYNANATSGATTLYFDDFSIGSQGAVLGCPVTDWQAFTPTGTWTTNTTYTGKWRRVGDSAEIEVNLALSGAPTSAQLQVNLPPGMTVDTSKLLHVNPDLDAKFGFVRVLDAGTLAYAGGTVGYASSTSVNVYVLSVGSTYANPTAITQSTPFTFGSGDGISLIYQVPIVGWSSNTTMSSDSSTRVVAAKIYTSSARTINNTAPTIIYEGVTYDTAGAYDNTTGIYKVTVSGKYRITGAAQTASTSYTANNAAGLQAKINGTASDFITLTRAQTTASLIISTTGSSTFDLKAGDTISIGGYSDTATTLSASNPAINYILIERISGPATIAASADINCRYTGGNNTIANGVQATLLFPTKSYDSNSAFNAATGEFTAPDSGKYRVTVYAASSAPIAASSINTQIALVIQKNGVNYSDFNTFSPTTTAMYCVIQHSDTVQLLAGEKASTALYNGWGNSMTMGGRIIIERVGNY